MSTVTHNKFKKVLERIARHHEGVFIDELHDEEVKIMNWAAEALDFQVVTNDEGVIQKMEKKA